MTRSWMLICALTVFLGGGGTYYFSHAQTNLSNRLPHILLSHPIETYIEQGEFIRFDENGFKKEQLYLHSAYHLKDHTVTHIVQPKLIQHQKNKSIALSAKQAEAIQFGTHGKIEKIIFNHQVKITSAPFQLNTSTLTYHPGSQLAKTDAFIDISSQNLHIQAKGMTIHLSSGKMELLNQVTSTYDYDSI